MSLSLELLDRPGLAWAQRQVIAGHYLRRPVDVRGMPEGYAVRLAGERIGCLLFGRPECTRLYPWFGGVQDVASGRAECTRWEVLNLARVWLSPDVQAGGRLYRPELLPGYLDRRGVWRSALASTAIRLALARIGTDYLVRRPPCFLEEPYQIRWLLSYCDTRLHRGVIYRAAGFDCYRRNAAGVETWRIPLSPLTLTEDAAVRQAAAVHPRSIEFRARRACGTVLPLLEVTT